MLDNKALESTFENLCLQTGAFFLTRSYLELHARGQRGVLFLHQDDVIKCVPIYLFSHLGKSQIYRCSQPQRSHIY